MRSKAWTYKVLFWLAALCPSWCYAASATIRQRSGASALLENFESVFYSSTDLLSGAASSGLSEQDRKALSVPFAQLSSGLKAFGVNAEADFMSASDGVLVGAKDFSQPQHIGSVQSRFCYVLILASRSTLDVRQYFSNPPVAVVKDAPVWSWPIKPSEGHPGPSSLYVAQVGRSYVVVTNELPEVGRVSDALKSFGESQTVLSNVNQWQYLSSHPLWGYRRYDESVKNNNKVAAGLADIASAAKALMFTVDLAKNVGRLRLETLPSDGRTVSNLSAKTSLPPWMPSGDGLWDTNIPLRGDEITLERLFNVMGLFGFGIYL
jgi:hypothetical protein